jgi:hypothetical protein
MPSTSLVTAYAATIGRPRVPARPTVSLPESSWASAGASRICRKRRPGIDTGSPEVSAIGLST